ncbi:MAG: hypothetical protein HC803_09195 [Saprospiraceae bacterium]|nr:hypothetical protein [Saprospiraceae bacterium]
MNSLFNYQSLMYQEIFKSLNNKKINLNMNIFKIFKTVLTAFALIGFTTIANAMDETAPIVTITQVADEKVKLTFETSDNQSLLTIVNNEGEVVYREVIKESNYGKIFDLRILEDGKYSINVEFENRIIKQNAVIDNNLITLGVFETIVKPVFTIVENTVSVQINGLETTNIEIEIRDENGYTFYEKQKNLFLISEIVRFRTIRKRHLYD